MSSVARLSDDKVWELIIPVAAIRMSIKQLRHIDSYYVTHLPLEKMAAVLADDNLKCIFVNENERIPIQISLKFVPMSPINNKPALIQSMAWHRTGGKPSPAPMLTQITDAYVRY